jgi:hypothetical protein
MRSDQEQEHLLLVAVTVGACLSARAYPWRGC